MSCSVVCVPSSSYYSSSSNFLYRVCSDVAASRRLCWKSKIRRSGGCQKLQQEGGSICAKEVRVAQSLLYTSFTDTSSFVPSIRSAGDEKEGTTCTEHYQRRGSWVILSQETDAENNLWRISCLVSQWADFGSMSV
jgi:hypothetical protein